MSMHLHWLKGMGDHTKYSLLFLWNYFVIKNSKKIGDKLELAKREKQWN